MSSTSADPTVTDPGRVATVTDLADRHRNGRGALLVVLHAVLDEFGWIADEDVPVIASVLNLSRAEVLGVLSFYDDFRRTPPPAHRIRLCRAEACQAVGAEALHAAARERIGDAEGVELGEVFCLGNCALGPSGEVDGRLVGRLTADQIDSVMTGWTL